MNPSKFLIFFFPERGGVEYFSCEMIISSKQGAFYNTTDVLFICSKKPVIGPIGHCCGDFAWSKDQFCCIQQLLKI